MSSSPWLALAFFAPLSLLCLQLACSAGAGKDGTNGTNGTNGIGNIGGYALTLPTATITLDGSVSDWEGLSPLATSIQGNGSATHPGSDVKALYAARDASTLYLRMDLWDGTNTAFWNGPAPNDGSYRFRLSSNVYSAMGLGVAYRGQPNLPNPGQWSLGHNGSNDPGMPGSLQGPSFVGVGASTIECALPLLQIGNPTAIYSLQAQTVSISGGSGAAAIQLDIAQTPQVQKVSIEGTVRAAGTGMPIRGALVATSLDGQTISTNAAGYFFLQTAAAPNYANTPYTITITAAGYATFSQSGVWGDHPMAQAFTLNP